MVNYRISGERGIVILLNNSRACDNDIDHVPFIQYVTNSKEKQE
jgi:hypothetical protein